MTPYKNYTTNPSWPNRLKKGGLYVAVAAMLSTQMGCGSDYEEVTVWEASKGVVTTVQEQANGEYSIVDEKVIDDKNGSLVIVKKLDGTIDTLPLADAQKLVQPNDTTSTHYYNHHGSGLGRVLWWGSMGYLMGRSFSSPTNGYVYREREEDRRYGRSSGGYFTGSSGFSSSDELRRTAVSRTEMRPAKGRSGFFRGFGRSGRG